MFSGQVLGSLPRFRCICKVCCCRLPSLMRDYIELTKPRITWLILMSAGIGYFFVLPQRGGWWTFLNGIDVVSLLHTILGTALIASGTAALNQWSEREADCKMKRTSHRPLPAGRISPG